MSRPGATTADKHITSPPPDAVACEFLMDTGASAGDFISGDLLARLQGAAYVYQTPHPIIVRGVLGSESFVSYDMLDIAFHFYTSKNVAKVVRLSVLINPHSSTDLIIGLKSFRKLNFFRYFANRFTDDPLYLNAHDESVTRDPRLPPLPSASTYGPQPGSILLPFSPAAPVPISTGALPVTTPPCPPHNTPPESAPAQLIPVPVAPAVSEVSELSGPPRPRCRRSKRHAVEASAVSDPPRDTVAALLGVEVPCAETGADPLQPGVVLTVDDIDNDKVGTFAPFLATDHYPTLLFSRKSPLGAMPISNAACANYIRNLRKYLATRYLPCQRIWNLLRSMSTKLDGKRSLIVHLCGRNLNLRWNILKNISILC
jgi:hypothetical protein